MIIKAEKMILEYVNYDLFIRDNLLCDRVSLYLENIKSMIPFEFFEIFQE